ncbi:uncharacterized protein LOC120185372 [Hibiscus syriacus]|uniref:uncharacterized protein LOC120185372 n=1 Tax=Hibiscus syriacus TaxID=106335 RepID=UPI001922EBD8|nr:uncharacterized protein LOC120185372 [Hibiscus syriacus]
MGVCDSSNETADHLFYLCPTAMETWKRLIRPDKMSKFLIMNKRTWLLVNLTKPGYFVIEDQQCDVMFGAVLWNIWNHQNQCIFDVENLGSTSILEQSKRLQTKNGRAILAGANANNTRMLTRLRYSKLEAPSEEWLKINTDGARNIQGYVTCGGVIRNSRGEWILGFASAVGIYSVLEVEL